MLSVEKTTSNDFLQDRKNEKPQYTYILGVSKDIAAKHIHHSVRESHCVFVKDYDHIQDLFQTVNSHGYTNTKEYPEIPRSVLQDPDNSLFKVRCSATRSL